MRNNWSLHGFIGNPVDENPFNKGRPILGDPATAAIMVGGSLITGMMGADASSSAGEQSAAASRYSAELQKQMFDTINAQQAPYRQSGYQALDQLGNLTGPGGEFSKSFTAQDLNSYLAPNYQFQLDQGLGALNNQMNATGGVYSGNTLKAINDYAQNFAGNAYQNAFNNYQTQQGNIFNRLSTIAGLGSGANQVTAQAGTTAAANMGNAYQNAGAAQAAGTLGSAQSLSSGLNNAATWYALSKGNSAIF